MSLSLQREYLPATASSQQHLVLLHGWGCNREIWRPVLAALRPWANLTLVDIPGLDPGAEPAHQNLDTVLAAILSCAPERAVYLGWSLGGQLAVALAQHAPQRVAAVVTVASNPRFTATEDWPGMAPENLRQFRTSVAACPEKALRRFDSLQVAGARQPRRLLRDLQALRCERVAGDIAQGLDWLAEFDLREACRALQLPQLHLLGSRDELLPVELAAALQALLRHNPDASIVQLPACSHLAPLEAGPKLAECVQSFLAQRSLLTAALCAEPCLDKRDVAHSFSQAAGDYDSVAQLQRDVGTALLDTLDSRALRPGRVLDLGSGTGYFFPALRKRFPDADYLGLDLAEGMLRFARAQHPQAEHWLAGDAEALPLATASVDLVFSSLALQWCHRPELLCAELARVLRPGGVCVFSSLGPGTLSELRDAWAAVDQHQHVNRFLPPQAWLQTVAANRQLSLCVELRPYRMQYRRVSELLHELKTLGAHNVNKHRQPGLTSRRALQGMIAAYEGWRENGLLPASYDVIFGVLEKP